MGMMLRRNVRKADTDPKVNGMPVKNVAKKVKLNTDSDYANSPIVRDYIYKP